MVVCLILNIQDYTILCSRGEKEDAIKLNFCHIEMTHYNNFSSRLDVINYDIFVNINYPHFSDLIN